MVWLTLLASQILLRASMSAGFLSLKILMNNSVESDLLGIANGLSFSTSAFGRYEATAIFSSV